MPIILIVQTDDESFQIKLTTHAVLLGRSSKCDFQINDALSSGKHLKIKLTPDGRATFQDLDTTNGTFINGSKMAESLIYIDDEVTVGATRFFLDESQMAIKEKRLHTREGARTSMTYIKLKPTGTDTNKVIPEVPKELKKPKKTKQPKKVIPSPKEKMEFGTDDNTNTNTMNESVSGDATSMTKSGISHELVDGKNVINLGKSSGKTEVISIDKDTLKKAHKKKRKAKPSKDKKEESKGLGSKLKNLFKK